MFVPPHIDFSLIVASLCGALVWLITQQCFDNKKQFVAFCISFSMGILGADVTLEVVKMIVPGIFSGESAVGAFFCSALVITLITTLIHRVSRLRNIPENKK
ncbi:phage holin family protein [Serratia marcescens]|nr:phage holin family protein [Serratia marcescens]MCW6023241.1 phage holin family protein [Serratia marcescens]